MTAVPEYFVKPAHELQRYRAGKAQERAQQQELANSILKDPEATEQKKWAQRELTTSKA